MSDHQDFKLTIDGHELPVESITIHDVDMPLVSDKHIGELRWPETVFTGCAVVTFDPRMFRRHPRYQRARWHKQWPGAQDVCCAVYGGRASVRALDDHERGVNLWRACVERWAIGALCDFPRRCAAKRWCETTLALWDAQIWTNKVVVPRP